MRGWIKAMKDTPYKQEVFEIAEFCEIDEEQAYAKCMKVWMWADDITENGHAKSVTFVQINSITRHTKFAQAMLKVGWLQEVEGGYVFPNFTRHNGKSAKKRALDAERKKMSRTKADNSHAPSGTSVTNKKENSVTREEKRREDNNNPYNPLPGEPADSKTQKRTISENFPQLHSTVVNALEDFISHRKKLKKPMTDRAIELLVKKIESITKKPNHQLELLETAIERGWQTVFEPKDGFNNTDPDDRFSDFQRIA